MFFVGNKDVFDVWATITIPLVLKIAELFLPMIAGWVLVRFKVLRSSDSAVLSKLAMYIITPCVIISSFQVEYSSKIVSGLMLSVIVAVGIQVILLAVSELTGKVFKLSSVERCSVLYSNAGALVIPLVVSLFGAEWVIYTTSYITIQLVMMWSLGRSALCGERRIEFKKIIRNVNILAIILGIILFAFRIRIPSLLSSAIAPASAIIGPMCMLTVGMLIADIPFKNLFTNKRAYLVSALRLVLCGATTLVILKLSGISGVHANGHTIIAISLLATITPSAASITQMAQVYGGDAKHASVIYALSTTLCIFTMPIIIGLYFL